MNVARPVLGDDSNELYCARLTEVAFALFWNRQHPHTPLDKLVNRPLDAHREQRAAERKGARMRAEPDAHEPEVQIESERYSRQELYDALLDNPKLQQMMAVRTHYVPSKWLLEQEMRAKGVWPPKAAVPPGGLQPDLPGLEPELPDSLPATAAAPTPGATSPKPAEDVYETVATEGNRLFGVCFSGGGIRSATFNLGVIQGLAQLGLLPLIDYLSSVSGGGYIHQFLAAWILRDSGGRDAVVRKLIPQAEPGCLPRAPDPIQWLLRYASYLTPQRGLFSADTWTMISIWLRNTILNQVPILTGLASGFFLIHILVQAPINASFHFWQETGDAAAGEMRNLVITGAVMLAVALVSLAMLGRNLVIQHAMTTNSPGECRYTAKNLLGNGRVQTMVVLPWLGCAVWMSFFSQMPVDAGSWLYWLPGAMACLLILLLAEMVIFAGGAMSTYVELHEDQGFLPRAGAGLSFAVAGLLATAVACVLGWGCVAGEDYVSRWLSDWIGVIGSAKHGVLEMRVDPWRIRLAILPALLLTSPYVAIEMSMGLLGRDFSDARREWLARLRAWSLLYGLLWVGLVTVALMGPYLVYWVAGLGLPVVYSTVATFLAAHLTTIFAGWSGKGDGKPTDGGILGFKPVDLLAMAAAPLTILSLLIAVSFVVSVATDTVYGYLYLQLALNHFYLADLICFGVVLAVAALFGWRVDINEFSMQSFYRNRLTRCYLGATVANRQPDPFTGFDDRNRVSGKNDRTQTMPPLMADLLPVKFARARVIGEQTDHRPDPQQAGSHRPEYRRPDYQGPFPIFCTTLNLTTGEDLATQERMGASFAFTPLYSGYSVAWTDGQPNSNVSLNGFVPTGEYAYPGGGIAVDTAAAISGAALNPNQGYNSNRALAFLMTFFNVRLGWWITNPRMANLWRAKESRPTPGFAIWYLFKELFGMVSDASDYVNLSDGGHFENMGLYELVRRRCSYIIVCDAEDDREMKFEGIGTAIAKCRSDFGAEIDLDLRPLELDEKTGFSSAHCVVGTITYPPPPTDVESEMSKVSRAEAQYTSCECLGDINQDKYTGVIVYLKSSLVGDEPADLLAYKLRHAAFPHDMTGNQWFTETQFESYRRLGHHIAMTTIQPALAPDEGHVRGEDAIPELFGRMNDIWYPRTPEMEHFFGDHLKQYDGILSELRTRPELAGLEVRLHDQTPWHVTQSVEWVAPLKPENSTDYAMQFGHSLLDFMYAVYTNLELAFPDNRTSPHAVWWICLFRRWCRVTLIRQVWLGRVGVVPEEFRLFAWRELRLPR